VMAALSRGQPLMTRVPELPSPGVAKRDPHSLTPQYAQFWETPVCDLTLVTLKDGQKVMEVVGLIEGVPGRNVGRIDGRLLPRLLGTGVGEPGRAVGRLLGARVG